MDIPINSELVILALKKKIFQIRKSPAFELDNSVAQAEIDGINYSIKVIRILRKGT